jgi:hypothetical protein
LVDTPVVVPTVATLTDDFKIRITIVNLSEKTTAVPHLQAVASLYVRLKIPDGYDGYTDGLSSSFEGKLNEEKLKLLDSAQIDPDNRLTPAQRKQVRELLAKRIDAFAVDPKMPNRTHLIEVELPLNPGAVPHRLAPSQLGIEGEKIKTTCAFYKLYPR